jgi:hypothetical protein
MKFFSWIALILLIIGGFGMIGGIKTDDAMLVAMSAILWTGFLFFEMLVMNEKLKFLLNVGDEK